MSRTRFTHNPLDALGAVSDGATVMVGGFARAGAPQRLLDALVASGAKDLTLIHIGAGAETPALGRLFANRQVCHLISTFARGAHAFEAEYRAGRTTLELVPQGTFAERIRAGGAGISAFFTLTGAGTPLADGKEHRVIDGRENLLETALRADVALIKAHRADAWGNLVYRKTARNTNPVMATAADLVIAEVDEVVALGELDPEAVVTPGIYVDWVCS